MSNKQEEFRRGCFAKALPDEPMFVLLARDPSAPELVEEWATKRMFAIADGERPKSDEAAAEEAMRCAHAMRVWRAQADGEWRRQVLPASLFRAILGYGVLRWCWMVYAPAWPWARCVECGKRFRRRPWYNANHFEEHCSRACADAEMRRLDEEGACRERT